MKTFEEIVKERIMDSGKFSYEDQSEPDYEIEI